MASFRNSALLFTGTLFWSVSIAAQMSPITKTIPVTFTGTVTNDVTNTIRLRQPDGSFANFAGPVPDYPYRVGDKVTLSFNATVPTAAFYAPGGGYRGQVAADGIYRIVMGVPAYTGGTAPGGAGNMTALNISGPAPIRQTLNSGQPTNTAGFTIVYDSNKDSYSLEFPRGNWISSLYSGPGYIYDAATNTMSLCNTGQIGSPGCSRANDVGISFRGDATSVTTGNATNVFDTAGNVAGFFSMMFSGAWDMPTYDPGTPIDVPEPGTLLLFAGGSAFLIRRQRNRDKQR